MVNRSMTRAVEKVQGQLAKDLTGPFDKFLPKSSIESVIQKVGYRFHENLFTPFVMIWAFIGQVLDPDPSCQRALARIQAYRARRGRPAVSTNTGGYCKARSRLPERLFQLLFQHVGGQLVRTAPAHALWHGRPVKIVDGTSASMPDTEENQREYPMAPGQKPGCGFPVASLVAVFSLVTGAAIDMALGPWRWHDLNLFSRLRHIFSAGDIVLADRGFCSFAEMALLKRRGVDSVIRLHQRRKTDFRRGRILGRKDHVVRWSKPAQCPRVVSGADYQQLPETLTIREIQYRVESKGFRPQEVTLATTLLDAEAYPVEDLAELYFRRWDIELDFRYLKTRMQMEVLRGQTPSMVRKEIYTHLLAYNLVRSIIWDAATSRGVSVDRISVTGTIQHILSVRDLSVGGHRHMGEFLYARLLDLVARQTVPYRPGRVEPRVVKRRPKPHNLMTRPRDELRAALRA